jgi:hypothetical protein
LQNNSKILLKEKGRKVIGTTTREKAVGLLQGALRSINPLFKD